MLTAGILVLLTGPDEPELVARLDSPGTALRVVRRCADLTEVMAAAEAGLGAVAILELGRGVDRARVAQLRSLGVRVIVLSPAHSIERARALGADVVLEMGVDFVASAVEQAQILGLLKGPSTQPGASIPPSAGAAAHQLPGNAHDGAAHAPGSAHLSARAESGGFGPEFDGSDAPRRGRVIAVWGCAGAPGRTTIAANLATELALVGASTLLFDVDTLAPSLAQVLGVPQEAAGIATVARAAGQGVLDPKTLLIRTVALGSGVRFCPGLSRADRWRELAPVSLDAVWEIARATADQIVLDLAGGLEEAPARGVDRWGASRSALLSADAVLVVVGADPIGMRRAVLAMGELDDAGVSATRYIVATNVRAATAGPRASEAVAQTLMQFAGMPPAALIPEDRAAFDGALLAGITLAEQAPRSKAREAIRELAFLVGGLQPATGSGRRWRVRRPAEGVRMGG